MNILFDSSERNSSHQRSPGLDELAQMPSPLASARVGRANKILREQVLPKGFNYPGMNSLAKKKEKKKKKSEEINKG